MRSLIYTTTAVFDVSPQCVLLLQPSSEVSFLVRSDSGHSHSHRLPTTLGSSVCFLEWKTAPGWMLLNGVSTGEVWIQVHVLGESVLGESAAAAATAAEQEQEVVSELDMYGFVVEPTIFRVWKRYQSYWSCRQVLRP